MDVVIGPVSRVAYHQLEARLREAGHTHPTEEPNNRRQLVGSNVDPMPVDPAILGFSTRWYEAMMGRAVEVTVAPGRVVRIVSPPYLLATKLEAFADRGAGDYLFSQDIGDIVALVDGRPELVNEVHATDREVREFVGNGFRRLLDDARFEEAIPAHLMPDPASQSCASAPRRSSEAELEHRPVVHDHEEFLARARRRRGFQKAYDALETEVQVANQLIAARAREGPTQDVVAQRMGTTKSAVTRLERSGKHTPSVGTLQRYAEAVGCELKIELVPKAG